MAKIIAVMNHKGGTGKTTTSVNLSAALARKNHKVLVIDGDPQSSLTFFFGFHRPQYGLAEVLNGEKPFNDVLKKCEDVWVLPNNPESAYQKTSELNTRYNILAEKLSEATHEYDYIIIDSPPTFTGISENILFFADDVIMPLQAEVLSLHGLHLAIDFVERFAKQAKPSLKILGMLPVMVDRRRNVTGEILDHLKKNIKYPMFEPGIRVDSKIIEAPSFGKSILTYYPNAGSAQDYIQLASQIIEKCSV